MKEHNKPHDNQGALQGKGQLEQALQKAREHEAILSQAVKIAGLGIWEYDILEDRVQWSEEVYRIYELNPEQAAPKMEEIIHYSTEEERHYIENKIYRALLKGTAYAIDCGIITHTGKLKYVHAIGQPFYNEQGKLTHLIGTISDITRRKQEEKNLQFSHFTIESLSDGVFWIDESARFIRVNRAASRNLGYTPEEMKGMTASDINPEFDSEKSQRYWAATKEKRHLVFRTQHTRKDGSTFPVEITNNIFEFEGSEFRCSIVRDITEQVKKEKEIERALQEVERLKDQLEEENIYLQEEIRLANNFDEIISKSLAYKKVLRQVEQVADFDATALIMGESGTGKELLARAIHALSKRKERPLVKINCATLPASIIESELFGHERGAFTGAHARKLGRFELANRGTIFLDEIGELPLELQAKLLRVLQEGEIERLGNPKTITIDVRVIAATNRKLEESVRKGEFRQDLFYRLNVFPIISIPLRERKEDIPLLVQHFVSKYAPKAGKQIDTISQKTMDALQAYNWPGNVRELENIVERAIIVSAGKKLEIGDWLPKSSASANDATLKTLEAMEKEHILKALVKTKGKVSGTNGAAVILGINAKTLDSRMRKLGIRRNQIFDM